MGMGLWVQAKFRVVSFLFWCASFLIQKHFLKIRRGLFLRTYIVWCFFLYQTRLVRCGSISHNFFHSRRSDSLFIDHFAKVLENRLIRSQVEVRGLQTIFIDF